MDKLPFRLPAFITIPSMLVPSLRNPLHMFSRFYFCMKFIEIFELFYVLQNYEFLLDSFLMLLAFWLMSLEFGGFNSLVKKAFFEFFPTFMGADIWADFKRLKGYLRLLVFWKVLWDRFWDFFVPVEHLAEKIWRSKLNFRFYEFLLDIVDIDF